MSGAVQPAEWTVDRAFLVSDLHLCGSRSDRADRFVSFLEDRVATAENCTLVVAGDLVDFWYGVDGHVPSRFGPLLDQLERLPRVVWIQGNRDRGLRRALPGSPVEIRDQVRLRWGSRVVHVEHGHRIGVGAGTRLLDSLLDSGVGLGLANGLGGERTDALGRRLANRRAGGASRAYDGGDRRWLSQARRHAQSLAKEGCALTVLGHGHYLGWWDEGLVCLGDWLHFQSYLELGVDGQARLWRYEPQDSEDGLLSEGPLGEIPR